MFRLNLVNKFNLETRKPQRDTWLSIRISASLDMEIRSQNRLQLPLFSFITIIIYHNIEAAMTPAPIKDAITFDDFAKLDIRVGTIVSVTEVAKSDKLMKLTVDFGDHQRSILAGIKQERENPQEIEGKQALFVVNLPDRKMAGELSQGMLFDIGYEDKVTPVLAMPEANVPNGTRAG